MSSFFFINDTDITLISGHLVLEHLYEYQIGASLFKIVFGIYTLTASKQNI